MIISSLWKIRHFAMFQIFNNASQQKPYCTPTMYKVPCLGLRCVQRWTKDLHSHHLPCLWFCELILDTKIKSLLDFVSKARTIPSGQWFSVLCIFSSGAGVVRFSVSHSGADSEAVLPHLALRLWKPSLAPALLSGRITCLTCPAAESGGGDVQI